MPVPVPPSRPARRSAASLGTVLALALGSLGAAGLALAPTASAAGAGLVINEVYGAGGNSGATLRSDFVELRNTATSPVSLKGTSLQYRSAGGTGAPTTGNVVALPDVEVPAGQTYLVKAADGAGGTQDLPTPDATSTLALSGTGGQVFLASTTSPLDPNNPAGQAGTTLAAGVVDLVGWGTSTTTSEGSPAPATTSTTSVARGTSGADTDVNSADLTAGAPTPTACTGCAAPAPTDPVEPTAATIAEIQGTGAASSPLVGETVTTTGVVTASYRTGGFNGLYVQTSGTGGAASADKTPGASDAVFVYGSNATPDGVEVGDSVRVTGEVAEFQGSTQVVPAAGGVTELGTALAPVTAYTGAWSTLDSDAEKEAHEGELIAPQGAFTVSDNYDTNRFGSLLLAAGTRPLVQPTDVVDAQDTAAVARVTASNAAKAITLDDGRSTNFGTATGTPLSWLTKGTPARVGSAVTFKAPLVLEQRFGAWNLQPRTPVTGAGTDVATFANTRTAAPVAVGGDLRLATFNVLNYFNTTGEAYAAADAGNRCTYYTDRDGAKVTVNSCTPNGPRGAADAANLARQQAKIVAAVNKLGASIVSLEEIENSVALGETDRDDALQALVSALNADAGAGTWAYAPSPAAADLPPVAEQDVIRTAFIYRPAKVELVGGSRVLVGAAAFDSAREPLAQGFKAKGAPDAEAFAVIVNHFKSKGSGADDGTGQGNANPERVAQAEALRDFAGDFSRDLGGSGAVFLTGDFNSYTQEDPLQVLYEAGYANLGSTDTTDPYETTYTFDGLAGSLDHVLANAAAEEMVTGVDIWNINADESVGFEYSRYNANVTDLYEAGPYRASDHDPEVVGLDTSGDVRLNLLNINDFHGRIDANTTAFATTVERLKANAGEDRTLFLSAGDNIGASLFASSLDEDQPTIDVLNALGLRASAVGNHEFDRGSADLAGRVSDEADWPYLAANVYRKGTTTPALPDSEYALFEVDGLTVGVIGTVTEETPSLVAPTGVADLTFGDPVAATNRVAARLSDGDPANGEADVIVAEYHEGAGAGTPDGATLEKEVAAGGAFADIVQGTSAAVDAIFTGHTHKQYAWDAPVPGVSGKTRPILQTGSYGENVGQIQLSVDPATGEVTGYSQRNVARAASEDLDYPRVAEVKRIVDAALAKATQVGNQPVGTITADITTAYTGSSRDDRSSESTLGDLVAQALKDGLADIAEPDLGITNPGGLRNELFFKGDTSSNPANTDGVVTYAEANAVLPFNNTVAVVKLTGAQLKKVLEEQWQTNADGTVPSRPYLQLGLSDNVRVTADPTRPLGSRITSVTLDDEPLDPARTYTVSTLSFLAAGGDNFRSFAEGTSTDTGLLDAELWRDYLAAETRSPDFARQQVFSTDLPSSVAPGQRVSLTLGMGATEAPTYPIAAKTLDLTSLGSPANTELRIEGVSGQTVTPIGTASIAGGIAKPSFTVPSSLAAGDVVRLVAEPSGTTVTVPVGAGDPGTPGDVTVAARSGAFTALGGGRIRVDVDGAETGKVAVRSGGRFLASGDVEDGTVLVTVPGGRLDPGRHVLEVAYVADGRDVATTEVPVTVAKDDVDLALSTSPASLRTGATNTLVVRATAADRGAPGRVTVSLGTWRATGWLRDGVLRVTLPRFSAPGTRTIRVAYAGTSLTNATTVTYERYVAR